MKAKSGARRISVLGRCLLAAVVAASAMAACDEAKPGREDHCDAVEFDGQIPPESAPGVEDVDETMGSTSALYPNEDTTLDTWYGDNDCEWSVGGEVPDDAAKPDIDAELAQSGVKATGDELLGELSHVEDLIASSVGPLSIPADVPPVPCGKPVFDQSTPGPTPGPTPGGPTDCYKKATPPPLDPTKPFGGRDIIFVHGLETDPILAVARNQINPTTISWPQNLAQFYVPVTGYWKKLADSYWAGHIAYNLRAGNTTPAPNRYLTVAWPTTQHLIYGANAMLSQIADAMNHEKGVINELDPSATSGFCASGCVVISHSTGGLLTDVAMALANETKTNATLRSMLGNIGYIPDQMRAHVALHAAFSGGPLATPFVALGLFPGPQTSNALCQFGQLLVTHVLNGTLPSCAAFSAFPLSVLFDLVPQVAQALWGPWVERTPVVTLTTAGGHPTSMGPGTLGKVLLSFVKPLLLRGMDDGVLNGDSQCATPNPAALAPAGYVAKSSPLDVPLNAAAAGLGLVTPFVRKVFDMGYPVRGVGFYVGQVVDRRFAPPGSPTRGTPYFVASECTPYVSPDGMVQPVAHGLTNALWAVSPKSSPLARSQNHYSFLLSTSDHYFGPTGSFTPPCYEETPLNQATNQCFGNKLDNNEEVRVITDGFVYTSGLVSSAMKTMVVENVKGRKFQLCKKCKKRWIWKRVYHRLAGWENLVEDDYVYRYVLR